MKDTQLRRCHQTKTLSNNTELNYRAFENMVNLSKNKLTLLQIMPFTLSNQNHYNIKSNKLSLVKLYNININSKIKPD